MTAWLAQAPSFILPDLQLNKAARNVINGRRVVVLPVTDDMSLFFTKEHGVLKVFIYKWLDKSPNDQPFTGNLITYSFQDHKVRALVYQKGVIVRWFAADADTPTPLTQSGLKTLSGEPNNIFNALWCILKGGIWVGYYTGCSLGKEGWVGKLCEAINNLFGNNSSSSEINDNTSVQEGGGYTGNISAGFWVGQGDYQEPPPFGTLDTSWQLAIYGGGGIWIARWVHGPNPCPVDGQPQSVLNDDTSPCDPNGGHWESQQIAPPDDSYYVNGPSASDSYTDQETGITVAYNDIQTTLINNPSIVDQLNAGDFDQVSWPPILMILANAGYARDAGRNYEMFKIQHPDWGEAHLWAAAFYDAYAGTLHFCLDAAGLIPVVGDAIDIVNGGIYYIEGDKINCALSVAAAGPVTGWVATGGKWGKSAVKVASQPVTDKALKYGYKALVAGKEIRFVKVAIQAFDYASLKALKAIKPADQTLTNISAFLVDHFALRVKPSENVLKNIIDDIVANGDALGNKTEQLADALLENEGYVKYNSKFGSNNGFDGVYIKGDPANPTDIIINEAKQVSSAGSIKLAGQTTNKAAQMSDTWIDQTILEMRSNGNASIQSLGNVLNNNKTLISKSVTAVDKSTSEIVVLKLNRYN